MSGTLPRWIPPEKWKDSMDILCVGLAVCDVLAKPVRPDALIADTSRLDSLELRPGGDAMNVACNLARQGVDVALVGRVGNDGFGAFLREELTAAGARDLLVVDPECATSTEIGRASCRERV